MKWLILVYLLIKVLWVSCENVADNNYLTPLLAAYPTEPLSELFKENFYNVHDKMENSIIKTKVNNLAAVFRNSIATINVKHKKVDIVFLIDSSSSIGRANFHSEINFVKKLISHFELSYNYTRVALITFSSQAKVTRHIDQIFEPSEEHDQCRAISDDMPRIKYVGGGTFTYGALVSAKEIFEKSRPGSKKFIFLVTDGFSNGKDPIPLAQEMKKNNVTIFTIGIKSGNYGELYNISSFPKETHHYLLESFREFEQLARGALLKDHRTGYSLPLPDVTRCNDLCTGDASFSNSSKCCHELASCECRIPSGHYACVCPKGYIGDGIGGNCQPCGPNTYWTNEGECASCPDVNHVTNESPAISVEQCVCKAGFRSTTDGRCEGITCPLLEPPKNGYFVKQPTTCSNVLNAACGARCKSGYQLTGTSLRTCQENGTWSGVEAECVLKTCPRLVVPYNGLIICRNHDIILESYDYSPFNDTFMDTYDDESKRITEAMPIDTECSYKCGLGYYLVGSRVRNCLPLSKWDGLETTCKAVLCPPLPVPKYGEFQLSECTETKVPYGTNCSLTCPPGFSVKGPETKTCTGKKNGYWTTRSKNARCVDLTPPSITCPDDLNLYPDLDQQSVLLKTLPPPKHMNDSSGLDVVLWSKPSLEEQTGVNLTLGTHDFTYIAVDKFNNKAECTFKVNVVDNQPPTFDGCVDPDPFVVQINKNAPYEERAVIWDEPVAYDNWQAADVTVTRSLEPGLIAPGNYQVVYTATDAFNNSNTCVLNITVQEIKCNILTPPINGQAFCAKNSSYTWCDVSCNEGFAISEKNYTDNFRLTCAHDRPNWDINPLPDCSKIEEPTGIEHILTISMESEDEVCGNEVKQDDLDANLSAQMKRILCANQSDDCDVLTEAPICIPENPQPQNDRDFYRISKRDVSDPLRPRKFRATFRIRLYTKLGKQIGVWSRNDTLSDNIRHVRHELESLETNVILQQTIAELHIDMKRLKMDELLRCPEGSVSKNGLCVQCPRGTYQNILSNQCDLCPLGTFNEGLGQTQCEACPRNQSTRREGRTSVKECKEMCPPGTSAKIRPKQRRPRPGISNTRSLVPFCRKCGSGEYQPSYNQIECLKCPFNLTSVRGSKSLTQCTRADAHICVRNSALCGPNGQCVVEEGATALYSCRCAEGYFGSHCEHRSDLCVSMDCFNGGRCMSLGKNRTDCICPKAYKGAFCEELIDGCDNVECQNGGVCQDGVCDCAHGFEGKFCEHLVDYCRTFPCDSGDCYNVADGYMCQCPPGVIGRRCHMRPCDNFPCTEHEICLDLPEYPATRNSFKCDCPTGLKGANCTEVDNPCDSQPCQNNGECVPKALRSGREVAVDERIYQEFECKCAEFFYGKTCEVLTTPDFVMSFRKLNTMNFVKLRGPEEDLSELSFCVWLQTNNTFTYGTIISYATREQDNAFTVIDYTGLVFYVNGNSTTTDIVLSDGLWHFLCVAWTSKNGYHEIYVDGKLEHSGLGLSADTAISKNGIFIIGQEQDSFGGGFSESETFIGDMAYFDIWDRFIPGHQVQELFSSCEPYPGSLHSWTDFKQSTHGQVDISKSKFCRDCSKDLRLSNGYVRYSGMTAMHFCNLGYQLRGNPYRRCMRTSEWSLNSPFCEIISCEKPPPIENGYVQHEGYTYLRTLNYVCFGGFSLEGNSRRTCLANGTWSGNVPFCKSVVKCKAIQPVPKDLLIVYGNDKGLLPSETTEFPVATLAEVSCKGRRTSEDVVFSCLEDGTWDTLNVNFDTICENLETQTASPPEAQTPDREFWLSLRGFLFFGCTSTNSNNSLCVIRRKTVLLRDLDNFEVPAGDEYGNMDVQLLSILEKRSADVDLSKELEFEDYFEVLIYGEGEIGPGKRIPELLEDTLRLSLCAFLEAIAWDDRLGHKNVLSISKENRSGELKSLIYSFSLPVYRNFKRRATEYHQKASMGWARARCVANLIPNPPLHGVRHQRWGYQSTFDVGTEVIYGCADNYEPEGPSVVSVCEDGGVWTAVNYTCRGLTCDVIPRPLHMTYLNANALAKHPIGTKLSLRCNAGYVDDGVRELECLPNGQWSKIQNQCLRVSCPEPKSSATETIVKGDSYFATESIVVKCGDGRMVTRTCGNDSIWYPKEIC